MKTNWLNGITGIVFDFNGTLVFDAYMHVLAWSEISRQLRNKEVTPEENHQMSGKNNAVILNMMKPELTDEENKALSLKKEAIYREMILKEQLPLVPGVKECFDLLKERNLPFTIASASIKENIDFFINHYHLDQWINPKHIRYDDGSYQNKIQMFKDAAEAISSPIESTLIFEDSPTGIRCAYEAGFTRIIQIKKESDPLIPSANFAIQDFTDLL
ncbi:MAG: HAD family phosphatase [Erysipelotrichaceae bacterium]|nr:HAD family phosphatase [Erysipelotrichaceae bacterium]